MTSSQPQDTHSVTEYLIARIAKGDTEALRQLYEQQYTAVYGFAYSFLKNPHDAQDVVQETFVSINTSAAKYRAQGKPMAWILTITKNAALMKLRDGKRTLSYEEAVQPHAASEQSFETQVHNSDFARRALSLLSKESRQIVLLHAVSGFKHREIADILGMKLSTVLSKYNRAITKIQNECKEDGYE